MRNVLLQPGSLSRFSDLSVHFQRVKKTPKLGTDVCQFHVSPRSSEASKLALDAGLRTTFAKAPRRIDAISAPDYSAF